jgi:hypothetical protein
MLRQLAVRLTCQRANNNPVTEESRLPSKRLGIVLRLYLRLDRELLVAGQRAPGGGHRHKAGGRPVGNGGP